jgi:hypothetical protein
MTLIRFKEADNTAEMEQVRVLNHEVFAGEVGQHPTRASGTLPDSLEGQSRYFVAMRNARVIGMISVNPGPVFSVSKRLPDLRMLRQFPRPLEVRLLAIEYGFRFRTALAGLLWSVYDFAQTEGFSHLLISAIENRESMYQKMGFCSLGSAVPEGAVSFIPMVMKVKPSGTARNRSIQLFRRHWLRKNTLCQNHRITS